MYKKFKPYKLPKPKYSMNNLISHGTSKEELDVYTQLRIEFPELNIYRSDRVILHGRELDIWIPSKKVAIEYNGLYFHNGSTKSKGYHLWKTNECDKQDIYLISLFSDEWENSKVLSVDLLKKALGKYTQIKNEDVHIKEISQYEGSKFLSMYHIQGNDFRSNLYIGAFIKDKLLSVISLEENKINRYSSIIGIEIDNCLSLFTDFLFKEKKFNEIFFELDRRLFSYKYYEKYGFIINSYTEPLISYTKDFKSRITESNKSYEQCKENSLYTKVYDSGKIILKKENK